MTKIDDCFTVNQILDMELFTDWEIEDIVLRSDTQIWLAFEPVGYMKEGKTYQLVYQVHDPEIKESLLFSWKRSELARMSAPAGE